MPPAVSGILLAGGASSRFGRDKLVESVGGRPLFQLPLAALAAVCDEVVLVVGPDAEPPALLPSPVPIRIARDERRHEGPLVAASVGLAAVGGAFALIAAGDMPGLRRELLAVLVERSSADVDAVALVDGERWRPLPSLVRVGPARSLARRLVDSGERRLRALVAGLRLDAVPEAAWRPADPEGAWRRDVDVPGDLAESDREG